MLKKMTAGLLAGIITVSVTAPAVMAGADEVIAYRKGVMNTVRSNAVAIMAMRRGNLDMEDNIGDIAQQMATASGLVTAAFKVDTSAMDSKEKTTAKDNLVWANWSDFMEKAVAMQADADAVAALAAAGDVDGAKNAIGNVFRHCKACHDTYRK